MSLELQGGNCSDQLTLICRHSNTLSDPNWIHNQTVDGGELIDTAFSGFMYSFQNSIEHRVTVTGVDNVTALDGYVFQCVYSIQSTLIKSNAVRYSLIPNVQSHTTHCLRCLILLPVSKVLMHVLFMSSCYPLHMYAILLCFISRLSTSSLLIEL